jgi:hypothetical protein
VKCGDVKCNEVVENLKGINAKGSEVKFIGNEVSLSVVQWCKSAGEQCVLCTVIFVLCIVLSVDVLFCVFCVLYCIVYCSTTATGYIPTCS